jgi:phenylacetate-coenzyme A ligase PaaK-like adenylate-forming protein
LDNIKSFKSLLYSLNEQNVDDIALRVFRYQAENNPIYATYIHHLGCEVQKVTRVDEIPFMPISFFKNHSLKTGSWGVDTFFASSGTSGEATSTHYIEDLNFYLNHAERCFTHFFGPVHQYHIFALLPSYLEQGNSSLVAMIDSFIKKSQSEFSGFYRYDQEKLLEDINQTKRNTSRKIILWGVSFALLEFAERFHPDLRECIVFETGGMKGRRKEITRTELHNQLKKYFNLNSIHSEYGMTELLSQAYTKGEELFYPSPWMKIFVRDSLDPREKGLIGRSGGLNVMDLANIHSIAFVETEDAGKVFEDGSFEVLGRLDNSDVRGCNLLVE